MKCFATCSKEKIKDTCVLEVDDIEDADIVDSLLDAHPPPGFQVISVHSPVGENTNQAISLCQTFSQLWRGKLTCTSRYKQYTQR